MATPDFFFSVFFWGVGGGRKGGREGGRQAAELTHANTGRVQLFFLFLALHLISLVTSIPPKNIASFKTINSDVHFDRGSVFLG